MGHSRRRWSFHYTHVKTRMLFQVPSPVSRESRWRKHWERESKEVEETLHPVAAPILGRVVLHGTDSSLQCQTLQREFEVTSRAQAWQRQCRDWHGVGEVTALSGCAERSHTVAAVSHLQEELCQGVRPSCLRCTTSSAHPRGVTAQLSSFSPLRDCPRTHLHWWVVTALPWLSDAAVSLS